MTHAARTGTQDPAVNNGTAFSPTHSCSMGVNHEQGAGLAFLLQAGDVSAESMHVCTVLDYVFDLSGDTHTNSKDPSIDFEKLASLVQQRAAQISSESPASDRRTAEASTSQPQPVSGRIGGPHAGVNKESVVGQFSYGTDGLTLEALGNFSSCRANVAVFKGKWYYEVTVLTSGIQQVCTMHIQHDWFRPCL